MSDEILVRIAVGLADDGTWVAVGDSRSTDDEKVNFLRDLAPITIQNVYFVEAVIPSVTVVGQTVFSEDEETVNAE